MLTARSLLLFCTVLASAFAWWASGALGLFVSGAKLGVAYVALWVPVAGLALWFLLYRQVAGAAERAYQALEASDRPRLAFRPRASALETGLTLAFLVAVVALTVLATTMPDAPRRLLGEHGPVENLTSAFYVVAAAAALHHGIRAARHRILRAWLLFLAFLFFVVGMEEISWGQRFLGLETPEAIAAINIQKTLTIHNIWSISLFTYPALGFAASVLFVAPLLRWWSPRWKTVFAALQYPVAPPIYALLFLAAVASYFAVGFAYGTPTPLPISWHGIYPSADDELLEFYLSALFLIGALTNWRSAPARRSRPPAPRRLRQQGDAMPNKDLILMVAATLLGLAAILGGGASHILG